MKLFPLLGLLPLLPLMLLLGFGCRTKETPPNPREQFLALDNAILDSRGAFKDRLRMEQDDRSVFVNRAREFRRKPTPPSNWKFTPHPRSGK